MTAHPALKTLLRGQIAALAQRQSRPDRYFARADAHMADMTPPAQLAFLRAELDKWNTRYLTFQKEVFVGKYEGETSAWEYAEVIAVIGTRIARLEREAVPA
jgi:hypothetical protein